MVEGLSESEVWDALEELYQDGFIDHAGDTVGGRPQWNLNDDGEEYVQNLFGEFDDALAYLASLAIRNAPEGDELEVLLQFAGFVRDDMGINMLRRLKQSDDVDVDLLDDFPEDVLRRFDPQEEDDGGS